LQSLLNIILTHYAHLAYNIVLNVYWDRVD